MLGRSVATWNLGCPDSNFRQTTNNVFNVNISVFHAKFGTYTKTFIQKLEKPTATHCSIFAWRTPWTKDPGGLQSMVLQRVRYNKTTKSNSIPK